MIKFLKIKFLDVIKGKTENKILARQWEIDSIKEVRAESQTLQLTALSTKTQIFLWTTATNKFFVLDEEDK